jgi:hypothetical protein
LSDLTEQSTVDSSALLRPFPEAAEFTELVVEMVADQAPHVFAVVLEYGERVDAQIVAWGMALDEGAYMTTVDGRNQYCLVDPESALKYVRGQPDTTPHLVWAWPSHSPA